MKDLRPKLDDRVRSRFGYLARDIVEQLSQEIAALRAEQSQLLALLDRREDGEFRSQRLARTATER